MGPARAAVVVLLVAAVGAAAAFVLRDRGTTPPGPEAPVVAAIDGLRARHPRVFEHFRLMDTRPGASRRDQVRRPEDVQVLSPRGRAPDTIDVLALVPRSCTRVDVAIDDARGWPVVAWSVDVPHDAPASPHRDQAIVLAPWPSVRKPLPPGHYAVIVAAVSPSGAGSARLAFDIAPPGEVRSFESAAALVVAEVPPVLRDLVLAHLAWRRGFLGEAAIRAFAAAMGAPADPFAHATAAALLDG